jgi:hypothetical protein
MKAVTRFLDSASTVVWEGVKEGANLSNAVATKMAQTVVNDVQRDHYHRGSCGGDDDGGSGEKNRRTYHSPITHRNSKNNKGSVGGGVKERIKIFNSTTSPTKNNNYSSSHTACSSNDNSPYQRRMGGGISGEQRRRDYEASIPLPMPIPLPIISSSTSTTHLREHGVDDRNNRRTHATASTAASTAATTTGRHNNRQHDHYEKENETNNATTAAAANSKRMYHTGMENFVSVLKSSSPKKLRKQQKNELKKVEKEGESSRNHCQPKKEPKDTDERESISHANNHNNHADNDATKVRQDQSNKKKRCEGDGISPKRWQDDAYLVTSSSASYDSLPMTSMEGVNDDNSSSSKMKTKKQRRGVNNYAMYQQHSLIQSPLQRHILAVHESACSNATCTVMKEPFQLQLVPSSSTSTGEETRMGGGGGGSDDHLDMLGAVAGHSMNYKKEGNNNNDRDDINNIALDLLSSAAFLFKTSRRNIL